MPNSFSMAFLMENYGEFQDRGVRGAGRVRKTTSKFNKTKYIKVKCGNKRVVIVLTLFKEGIKRHLLEHASRNGASRKGLHAYAVA
jgi:hypothetical protein